MNSHYNRLTVTCIIAIALCVALDIWAPYGAPRNVAVIAGSYAVKTLAAIMLQGLGIYLLIVGGISPFARVTLALYCAIVFAQLGRWTLNGNYSDYVTIFTNPRFSVWTWLLPVAIPALGYINRFRGITKFFAAIPAILVLLCLGILCCFNIFVDKTIDVSPVCFVFMLCLFLRTGLGILSRAGSALLCLSAASLMIWVNSRSYAIILFASAVGLLLLKRVSRRLLLISIPVIACIPLLYEKVVLEQLAQSQGQSALVADTRSFLFYELFSDFDDFDVWFGRGLNGTYFSPYFYSIQGTKFAEGADYYYRYTSEVGWLNAILKTGVIGLSAYILVIIAATLHKKDTFSEMASEDTAYRRVCLAALLLYTMESPANIHGSYLIFYLALGTLAFKRSYGQSSRAPKPAVGQTEGKRVVVPG